MRIFNAFGCMSLTYISRLLSFGFAIVLFSVSSQSIGAPLPVFSDPNLQACFDELAFENNWVEAEDVDILLCSDRDIVFVDSLEQLTNLVELDLSDNPLDSQSPFPSLLAQAQTLEKLNLSGTSLLGLFDLFELQNLTHLLLNDVTFMDEFFDAQQEVVGLVFNNPSITHLGLNGLELNEPDLFLNDIFSRPEPLELVSLELSDTGVSSLPFFALEQLSQLEVLDLSDNPLSEQFQLFELFQQTQGLEYLNLSNTNLSDLNGLLSLRSLSSLFLNNDEPVNYSTQTLNQILLNNQSLTDLGLSGIQLQPDLDVVLDTITGSSVVNLEIANTGAADLVLPDLLIERLESLDVSSNNLTGLANLELAEQLESLILNNNAIVDIAGLLVDLPSLDSLSLLGNETIACDDLGVLAEHFGNSVQITNPENCGVVEQEEPIDSAALFAIISLLLLDEQRCPIVTSETTVTGNQEVSNQADLDALEGVTQIVGSLNFLDGSTASEELDLSSLNSLVTVTGNISGLDDISSLNCLSTVGSD